MLVQSVSQIWQAKFPNGGLILGSSLAASKNDAQFKSGQNRPKNNHLASLI